MMEESTHSRTVAEKVETVEIAVAQLLRIGVVIASVLITLGLGGMLVGISPSSATRLITIGLIVLVLTPIMRVVAAVVVYLREGDYVYAFISLFVLLMLATGLLIGKLD